MHVFIPVFLLFVGAVAVSAQHRNDDQLRMIAVKQLCVDESAVEKLCERDHLVVFTSKGGHGLVVVARDGDQTEILGYAEGQLDANTLPDGLIWWMETTNASIASGHRRKADVPFTPTENFALTKWGQKQPYNLLCPVSGGRTLTGCAATALSQAMKIFNYPLRSEGSATYYVKNRAEQPKTLNTEYSWNLMADEYHSNLDAQTDENLSVAELLRDCGYAVSMNYSTGNSAAYTSDVAVALTRNFGYDDHSIRYAMRDYYSNEEWMTIIYDELANHHPVVFSGIDELGSGHAFLFSGVDAGGRIYVNWGWDGVADGFFDFSDLAPANIQGNLGQRHYNNEQEMVFGITPEPDLAAIDAIYSEWVTTSTGYLSSIPQNNLMRLGPLKFYNYHYQPFVGTIDLVFEQAGKDTHLINIYKATDAKPVKNTSGFSLTKAVTLTAIPAGTYNVYMGTKAGGDVKYRPLRVPGGPVSYEVTKAENGTVTVSNAHTWTDAITNVTVRSPQSATYRYSLTGQPIGRSQHGIQVVKMTDGSVRKQYVR